jgi:malonyl-CoA/methylmalonyl-CoA synthetase
MTETLMLVSNPYDSERRPGSVGFPLPGVELRLSIGREGEIQVRGPNVLSGYWERSQATAESFVDGWFRTGDLGSVDPDGYIRILGRSKELIISGGLNVYPREVEEVLLAHPDVAEVAVVGTPSDEWGEVVTAFVVPAATNTAKESLLAFAAEQLAPFKRPRQLHFVGNLPRNALGKVLKRELAS